MTASPEDSFEPAWSTDGGTIAFSANGAIDLASLVAEGASRIEVITDRPTTTPARRGTPCRGRTSEPEE